MPFLFLVSSLLLQQPQSLPATSYHQGREGLVVVVLDTEVGIIRLDVDVAHAPITARNFLTYVDRGLYNDGEFHRAVRPDNEVRPDAPIQVIQARIDPAKRGAELSPIPLERTVTTGLRHVNGTVSMARDVTSTRPGPDTATSGFFICIGDQPVLDYGGGRSPDGQGFAAFGLVSAGMDVVKKIQMSPTPRDTPATKLAARGQTLVPTIRIIRAYRQSSSIGWLLIELYCRASKDQCDSYDRSPYKGFTILSWAKNRLPLSGHTRY